MKTRAVLAVELGQPAHDVGIVSGVLPEDGAVLTFRAYRQKTNSKGDVKEAVCTEETLVFTSEPIPITKPGEYTSDEVVFDKVGTYYWVEILTTIDGTILHQGICGAPDETTVVHPPKTPDTPQTPDVPDTPGVPFLPNTGTPVSAGVAAAGLAAMLGGSLLLWARLRSAPGALDGESSDGADDSPLDPNCE